MLLAPTAPGAPPYTVEGNILDYTGEKLTIQGAAGGPRAYPADRVLQIETNWNVKHQSARTKMAKHDYRAAIGLLTAAERDEQRLWVRRMIVAELVQSYAAVGQWERASDLFIALTQSDPATPVYRYAPLAWYATSAVRPEKARAWMARGDVPAAVLLGASYLLMSTGDSQAAAQALRGLTRNTDPQVSALAESQLWRLEVQRVDAEGVERWRQTTKKFPRDLLAGPYFVMAEACARQESYDRAASDFLFVTIMHDENRHLAARAMVSAAQALAKGERPSEAVRLLNDVVKDFADTPQKAEAQALLRELSR